MTAKAKATGWALVFFFPPLNEWKRYTAAADVAKSSMFEMSFPRRYDIHFLDNNVVTEFQRDSEVVMTNGCRRALFLLLQKRQSACICAGNRPCNFSRVLALKN